jgi:hypothetical protein
MAGMSESAKPPARLNARVEEMVSKLSRPLSYYDKLNGWNDETRDFCLKYFAALLEDLGKPGFPHLKYRISPIPRTMDACGIHAGPLFDLSDTIAIHLSRFQAAAEEPDD